jgi:hypothetical protein
MFKCMLQPWKIWVVPAQWYYRGKNKTHHQEFDCYVRLSF